MNRITLWAIEIFSATVETGSVAAAAKRLTTSPSSISQQISNLETALGATLLDRSSRPVTLTPAGVLFQKRALRILAETRQARAELTVFDYSKLSRFGIAMIDDFDADVTPELMSQLSTEMPECNIVLQTGASHSNLAALRDRKVDVCVTADPEQIEDWMEIYPLLNEPFVILAPATVSAGSIDDLLHLPFIRFPENQVVGRIVEASLKKANIDIPHKFSIDSYQSIMAMVANGTGWAIAPPMCYLRAQRFQHQVTMRPLHISGMARVISLIARKETLDQLPNSIAARMQPLIQSMLIDKASPDHPWLTAQFRALGKAYSASS